MVTHQLVDSSVFDRSGYLIGKVRKVHPLTSGDFSLVVQLINQGPKGTEVTIDNHAIKGIDSDQKLLHVDLDHRQFMPNAGQGIQLMEERLVVNRNRRKVGEISVQKVVETVMVEVPLRREKLVVTKLGEDDPLVEMSLGEDRILEQPSAGRNIAALEPQSLAASGDLQTIAEAIHFLEKVAHQPDHCCQKVRAAIFLQQGDHQEPTAYQFETPEMAIQVLSCLEPVLSQQCSRVRLELLSGDNARLQTYQTWFDQTL